MKSHVACFLGLLTVACICGVVGASAQTTAAQVSGLVTDSAGAVVPQAIITVTNVDTGVSRKAETSATGYYVIPLLPPGNYRLTAEREGFRTADYPNVVLQVNQTLALDLTLEVGMVAQSVTVEAQAPLLQATSSNLGAVITSKATVDLPLNGRNFSQLLILTPGVTPVSTGQFASVGGGFGSNPGIPGSAFSQPSVGGQWNRGNFFLMDGLNFTTWFTGTYTVLPVLDGIQEFKVQSHNDSAEYGGALGGIVNVATKSGTNGLHGSAWEFLRNDVFDARNPFTDSTRSSPAPFRQNEFGFSAGGPVYLPKVYNGKNKTWFFFAYEGWRYRKPAQTFARYPTAAELNGDFSANYSSQVLFDPVTTRPDPNNPGGFIRDPFVCDASGTAVELGTLGASPCNKIPTSRINPMSLGWLTAVYDAPNLTGNAAYNFVNNGGLRNDANTYVARIDQRISDRDNAWFRFTRMYMPITTPVNSKVSNIIDDVPTNLGGGETHLFSPNLILDTRFGFNIYPGKGAVGPNAGNSAFEQLGFKGIERYGYVDLIVQAPYTGLGMAGPYENREASWDFSGNLTWVRGHHSIKTGFQLFWLRYQCCALEPGEGQRNQYFFTNQQTGNPANIGTTGDSLASALLGAPGSIYFAAQKFDFNFPSWAPFFEDRWQVTPKLSVTLGFRYDYTHSPHLTEDMTSLLDPATGNWLIGGGKLPPPCDTTHQAPCIPGDGNLANIPFGDKIRVADNPDIGPKAVRTNFGPRLGFAWRPRDKTVVRGGYGLVYGSMMGMIQTFQANVGAWPQATNTQLAFNRVGEPLTTIQDLQSLSASPLPTASPWTTQNWMYDPDIKNARSHQWNVGIQQEMTNNLMLSVAYVGSKSDRLNVTGIFNVSPTAGAGTAAEVEARRPFPWAAATFMGLSLGSGRYNSLQFSAEKRYSAGLQFLISYTWSKATDNGGSGYFGVESGPGGNAAVQNIYDLTGNWGVSSYDIPHYFSAAIQYEFPFGKGKRFLNDGLLSHILGNWQMNTITALRSGQPYNLDVLGDVGNVGNSIGWWNYARPNLVGDPHVENPTAERYFNPDAFEIPVNSFGNFGKNVLRSASVYNVDFSLFKRFPIREKMDLEFRAEAFNVFNIQNLAPPGVDIGTANAGVVFGVAVPPREIQFGLKFRY
jgi:outer membrane receptor protein involved in Fe transport